MIKLNATLGELVVMNTYALLRELHGIILILKEFHLVMLTIASNLAQPLHMPIKQGIE
jgi:hypothetical protein